MIKPLPSPRSHPYAMPPHRASRSPLLPFATIDEYAHRGGGHMSNFESRWQQSIALMNTSVQHMGMSSMNMGYVPPPLDHTQIDPFLLTRTPPHGMVPLPMLAPPSDPRPSSAPSRVVTPPRARSESLVPLPSVQRATTPSAARGSAVPSQGASPCADVPASQRRLSRSARDGTPVPPRPQQLPRPHAPANIFNTLPPPCLAGPSQTVQSRSLVLANGQRAYASVMHVTNVHGMHLVIVDRATAAAMTGGVALTLHSMDGTRRFKASVSPTPPPEGTTRMVQAAISRASQSIAAARARDFETAAAATLVTISTPREATFGAKISDPIPTPLSAVKRDRSASVNSDDEGRNEDRDATPQARRPLVRAPSPLHDSKTAKRPRIATPAARSPSPVASSPLSPPDEDTQLHSDSEQSSDDDEDDYLPPGERKRAVPAKRLRRR